MGTTTKAVLVEYPGNVRTKVEIYTKTKKEMRVKTRTDKEGYRQEIEFTKCNRVQVVTTFKDNVFVCSTWFSKDGEPDDFMNHTSNSIGLKGLG